MFPAFLLPPPLLTRNIVTITRHHLCVCVCQVTHVVIDEVDTMLTQGFGSDIRAILRSTVKRHRPPTAAAAVTGDADSAVAKEAEAEEEGRDVQLIMSTATLTKAVRALLQVTAPPRPSAPSAATTLALCYPLLSP